METINITDLLSKFPTINDQRLFLKEAGKLLFNYIIIGFYFPTYRGFDTKFFISFIREEKKVILIFNFFL